MAHTANTEFLSLTVLLWLTFIYHLSRCSSNCSLSSLQITMSSANMTVFRDFCLTSVNHHRNKPPDFFTQTIAPLFVSCCKLSLDLQRRRKVPSQLLCSKKNKSVVFFLVMKSNRSSQMVTSDLFLSSTPLSQKFIVLLTSFISLLLKNVHQNTSPFLRSG